MHVDVYQHMSHVLRQDWSRPVAGLNLALQRTLCFEFYWFYCFCAWHDACFTQQERRLTNIKPNVHSCFFCMIWLKWVKHIWQSWPKMSENIMDLSLQISLVFRKPLQLRRGFKGARATIEICQLAADSFAGQDQQIPLAPESFTRQSKSDKHLTLSPPQQSQCLSERLLMEKKWEKNIVSKRHRLSKLKKPAKNKRVYSFLQHLAVPHGKDRWGSQ